MKIITDRSLLAQTPMGWTADEDDPRDASKQTQRVVSFSETPLEHIYSLVAEIADRRIRLQPYGLALTKMTARTQGANPVWYVDMTVGHTWQQPPALNPLRDAARATGRFHDQPAAKLFPYFEPMGTWNDRQREFWWEREWRHVGQMRLVLRDVALWLCPENEIDEIEDFIRGQRGMADEHVHCVDPRWGLEQIIATLAGQTDTSPFGHH